MRGTDLHLRPAEAADLGFLRALYASTRSEEMLRTGWQQSAIDAFLTQQFEAQHRHYQEHYPDAEFSVVLLADQAIGRLYLFRGPSTYNLMDLSLLPPWRGQGIGSHLLSLLVQEADAAGRSTRLYVEPDNPARRLYERFGFIITCQHPVYLEMHRPAARRLSA
ncbi:GNAT family N-acetyltransferase [Ectopseudomonas guguanensis]|jgi:ribosomal protein S18 acetylase RimI-like enzyme|uniref:GNAT family N-acetyltransferase n=1 Tax=Ectopseudomonas guguanensis TaxID=1198456 RepID=UPI00286791A5|nr:N-acetyltransferase [Pseudomonas guguanensis]MDR8012980.1 N-acetyltransferase [Pseudomonas guguanensis]